MMDDIFERMVREMRREMRKSFEDLFNEFDDFFNPYETSEREGKIRQNELEETEERTKQEYRRERSLMPRKDRDVFPTLRFLEPPEVFEEKINRWAEEHPDYRIDAKNVTFPNGYYRSVEIKSDEGKKRRLYRDE
jgi:hypothetical protein